ncbi:Protransforming growth factor alpha [Larimichthys crocea]|uniref:Uncharacterized protein n=1 Tax=Larimichthys crocea TaxID=215358 RepID=A0ACD3RJS6_LARCR|nr:Protransforming growth factor alpha [Larimichthys crocea]
MTRIFWDAIFLISGSLFTFGAGPSNSTIIEASISIDTNSTAISNISTSGSVTTSSRNTTTTTTVTTTTDAPPVKEFVAAAVRSHFDDCPDSHRHFCFHGSCRFLILEETPACVCHPGFVGMRCEHADLLAVVATNHRQQTVATVLVLCVIGCVLIMVLCTLLHFPHLIWPKKPSGLHSKWYSQVLIKQTWPEAKKHYLQCVAKHHRNVFSSLFDSVEIPAELQQSV